jgi:predicted nucleic acid-binding protein
MSGKNWLLDTNIIIYMVKNELDLSLFTKENDTLYISSVSYMECLGYNFSNAMEEQIITELCNGFKHILIENKIIKQTIEIRKKHKIKLPDAIIAATAIINKLPLVSHNTKDFIDIDGLKLLDPFQL